MLLLGLLLQPDLLLLPLVKKDRVHRNICGDGTTSHKLLVHEPTRTKATIHNATACELLLLLLLMVLWLLLLLRLLRLVLVLVLVLLLLLLMHEE